MQTLKKNLIRQVLLVLSLMLVIPVLASPLVSTSYAETANSLKPVYITKNSYIKLDSADLIPSKNGNILSYTITIFNKDKATIKLQDYWTRLADKSGAKYTIKLVDSDKTKKEVVSNSSTTLTYYSELPANMTMSNLVIKMIKFDFSVSGYERTLGSFTFSQSYSNDVKVGGYKAAKINSTNVNMRINKSTISTGVEDSDINIEFVMRNTGKSILNLNNYQFYMQTASGSLYKLDVEEEFAAGISLRPAVLETIDLTGEIPASIKTNGAKLVIAQNIGDASSEILLPVAKILLGFVSSNLSSDQYLYTEGDHKYELKVNSINKYPWKNFDNVIAKVKVTNKGLNAAPVPKITGEFYIDNSTGITTTVIPISKDLTIPAQSSVDIYYYGNVPSSFKWSDLKLKIFEVKNEKKRELTKLKTTTSLTPKTITLGTTYSINDAGEKLTTAVTNTRLYEGDYNNLFAVYMDITNMNNRAQTTDKWTGYLETADGSLYETKIVKTSNSINPSKKEQVIITAEIPSNADVTGATLLLGMAFNDTGLIANDDVATGYMNAARFQLPVINETATTFDDELKVGPFDIDFTSLISYERNAIVGLNIAGTVKRNPLYDGFSNKTFKISLEDESTNIIMLEKTVNLDTVSGDTIWKTDRTNYTEFKEDMTNKKVSQTVTVNIYEELNGYKFKMLSKRIDWSPYRNWVEE